MSSLSPLSRGAGQVIRKKQEKLEVRFDPEDYLSWTPPETRCHVNSLLENSQDKKETWRTCLPKTYSTKTGALILYSEDLAKPSRKWEEPKKSKIRSRTKNQTLQIELHTLQDLAQAILAYGAKKIRKSKKGCPWQPYLHFLNDPEIQTDRQMRPGYSPKRYLLKLSQTWDPGLLQKLQREGYIRDPLLLEEHSQDHRKRQQDLSAVPPKYNLLHIYCSPWPYLQAEVEEQQTHPGLGPSSHKQSEERPRLSEERYEGEPNTRGMAQIPLRISVRKLSFHFRPQQTKETARSQDPPYKGIPRDRWTEVRQDRRTIQEHLDHNVKPKQAVGDPASENTSIDASELWCEKSHVTFYGGFFPGKNIIYTVTQRHLKNADGKEMKPSVDPGLFPPVQTGTHSECDGLTKKYKKQVPQIFQLPQICEDSSRAPWKKPNSSELSKELVILPLLVRLRKKAQPEGKKLKETCCIESKPKVAARDEQLAPLQNNLTFQLERCHERQPEIRGGLPNTAQDSFHLPPINKGELTGNGRKTKRKEACAVEKVHKGQRERHNGASISDSIMGPEREIVCPAPLGSVQTTDDLRHFGFVPDNEVEDGVLNEEKTAARHPPESTVAETLDEKEGFQLLAALKNRGSALCADRSLEIPQTQHAGKPQGNRNGFGNEPGAMENESPSLQFRKENQQSQGGLCRNNYLQQSEEEKGLSILTQTKRPKPKNGADFAEVPFLDTGRALDNLPLSDELKHLEPHLAHPTISEWEMESVPQANNIVMKLLDHSGEFKESVTMDVWPSEQHFGTGDEMALPENTSKKAKVTGSSRASAIIENKQMTKQKKRELKAIGSVSKEEKRPKKEGHRSQVFVVVKPRPKKAARKTGAYFKEKLGGVKGSETADEPNQGEGKREGDADMDQFDPFVEEEGGGRGGEKVKEDDEEEAGERDGNHLGSPPGQSRSPSSPIKEAAPLVLEESQPVSEDAGRPPGSHNSPGKEPPTVLHPPGVLNPDGSQADVVQENLSAKKEEAKRSRERMIAERAEKRRLAVERKRREQEELKRQEQEQQERMERMKEEMEQEQQRRIEEMRLRKQLLEEERQRLEEEAERRRQAEKAAQERMRQQEEEHRRKILEMQKKKQQEEKERAEAEKRRQKERELWLEEERRRLAEMAEEQRLEYEKQKQEEEEKVRREAEERRKKHEEAARIALEEARKHALLLARQKAELEKQQQFQYKLRVEASGLEQRQEISRPWVYSYFQHPYLKVGDDD
uniref:Uncharacterized protein KIAA2012 homolog isoform X2 n=1 Tax=Pogona vitticeps TaxID=103695 RepID=A0ABM5ENT6_9SAUR